MTLRVKQAFCKVNNKIQQLRGEIKLSLPCCLFLNNPTFPDFVTFLRHHIAQIENQ